ncbi:hypothetical protein [Parvibaculum sp.]|uniref:hypothetical protein n=1 Tax=Parvibaculum sp. TaxID=2024848 RepID=UPI001D55B568|nr:hypothetical protein [Parvibaculum sp.]MBX3490864.1 hypothetical protein [Parvibaculum sp.]
MSATPEMPFGSPLGSSTRGRLALVAGERRDMQPCPACGGNGFTAHTVPECCGNPYPGGECKGHCAVPSERQEQCFACLGTGEIPSAEAFTAAHNRGLARRPYPGDTRIMADYRRQFQAGRDPVDDEILFERQEERARLGLVWRGRHLVDGGA